jgi:hypothetical protein
MLAAMVSRTRLKSILTGLALYTIAGLMVAYFGVNAYTGKYGLNARQELDQEIIALTSELARLKRERAEGVVVALGPDRPRYARRAGTISVGLCQSSRPGPRRPADQRQLIL